MDHRDEFQSWCDLWDKALDDGVFPSATPEQAPEAVEKDVDTDPYYDYMDAEMQDQMLQEQAERKAAKALTESTKIRNQNPIYPDTVGKDQVAPKAGKESHIFEKVLELKQKLYDIECKLSETYGGGKKWHATANKELNLDKKLLSQIESLRKQIDNLSDNLGMDLETSRSNWTVEG